MSAILESALDSTRKAAADAWDAKAAAALKRDARAEPFAQLVAHLESACSLAALIDGAGTHTDSADLHSQIDSALDFARRCVHEIVPEELTPEELHFTRREEEYMEQARGF